jgi:hypothetical protein
MTFAERAAKRARAIYGAALFSTLMQQESATGLSGLSTNGRSIAARPRRAHRAPLPPRRPGFDPCNFGFWGICLVGNPLILLSCGASARERCATGLMST